MYNKELISEYEEILLGIRKSFSSKTFKSPPLSEPMEVDVEEYKEKNATTITKYAFSLLNWSQSDLELCLNHDLLKKLKLYLPKDEPKIVKMGLNILEYIPYPNILDRENPDDIKFLVNFIFNNTWGYAENDLIMQKYQKYLDGELEVPSSFFNDDHTLYICTSYFLARYYTDVSDKWYEMCADKTSGQNFLNESKLKKPASARGWDALDLVHNSLPKKYRSNWLYHHYCFMRDFEKISKHIARYGE